jgi:hypothetical protein
MTLPTVPSGRLATGAAQAAPSGAVCSAPAPGGTGGAA